MKNDQSKYPVVKNINDLEYIGSIQFSTNEVIAQIKKIQELMQQAMKEGEHFGKIPGCGDKLVLFKAGAEKLSFMFRLAPQYEVNLRDLGNNHREYEIITTLIHITTGKIHGQGIGSCSTMESKYRFRLIDSPYKPKKDEADKLKKEGRGKWRKQGDEWIWQDKVEFDNPADNYNTVLKMAKKRSLIDAILTATAASDIFTQDLEDLIDDNDADSENKSDKKAKSNIFDRDYTAELLTISTLEELKEYYENLSEKEKKNLARAIKNRKEEILQTVK